MNREDFPFLNQPTLYFDNGATALKPVCMLRPITEYYTEYTANAHRGDYRNSLRVDMEFEKTRTLVKDFINATDEAEIVFTSGTTDSLNRIVFGYAKQSLQAGDEVLITKSEHASNVLPWFELADEIGIRISYIELNQRLQVKMEQVKKAITPNTKIVSIAHVTNVVGDVRPLKEIIDYCHQRNIIIIVDGAQSVAHMKVDVQALDIDFLAFSSHKMCGPTGVGVLYGKKELLQMMKPTAFGGGMNASFTHDMVREYKTLPFRLEAGTQNVEGVIAFGKVIEYLNTIGIDQIQDYCSKLRMYAVGQLKTVPGIILYNEYSEGPVITFNIEEIFAQDLAIYLDKHHICVRAGNHCAKILKDELGIKNTCRMSLYFYNTKEEIDQLIAVLKNPNIKSEIL